MHPAAQPLTPVLVPHVVCIVAHVARIIASSPQHQQEAVSPLATPAASIKQCCRQACSTWQLPGYPLLLCQAREDTAAAVVLQTRQGLNERQEVVWMYGTHLPFLESSSLPGLVYLGKRVVCNTSQARRQVMIAVAGVQQK